MTSERVVIAGGGVGALEGMLAVQQLAGHRAQISVLTAGRHLTYRALSVTEPFSGAAPERYEWGDIARDRGITWIPDVLVGLRPGDREVDTRDGGPVAYDSLLLALGARPEPAVPGAITFAGPRDQLRVIEALEALADDRRQTVAFVAAGGIAWTLPLYELALLTTEYAKHHGLDLNIEIVTRESVPLGIFGATASADVARRLAAAGIHLRTATFAKEVEDHTLWLELQGPLEADLVIALPRLTGQRLPGLPCDEQGFVPVDAYGRVHGLDRVWAVGDMTTRPLKQGGLATQQADVAAADIASCAGAAVDVQPYHPVLQGYLFTGHEPVYLEQPHAESGQAGGEVSWWPAHKVVGRRVAPFLEALGSRRPRESTEAPYGAVPMNSPGRAAMLSKTAAPAS